MHIQQLMSLANGPEAGSQPRAAGPSDGSAFASTLARAAAGSDRLPAAARHDQGAAVSADGREALSELRQALLQGDRQALEALSARQGGALSADGREALTELRQALLQGDQQALEALSARQGGALSEALARLQQQLVQAGHRPAADEAPEAMPDLPGQFQARAAQASEGATRAARDTTDGLASLLTELQARLEQLSDGAAGSDPTARETADGLATLVAQLQTRLAQASAGASSRAPAATEATDGLASLVAQLQERLDRAADRPANAGQYAPQATGGLAGLLAQLQARLDQVSDRAPASSESLTALQQRLALIQQAGRPSAAGNAAIDDGRPETPRGAEMLASQGATAANDAARTTQAAVERSLAEQAQALRQITGDSQATSAARQSDAIAEALLASRQEAPRVGSGMSQPGGEPPGNGLAAASPSLNAGTLGGGTTTATATASLSAPVGTAAWNQQLGQQLMRISQQGGEQRVQLKLHPAELGPLSVSLTFGDQGAQAQFLSGHAQVRQALEQAIPQLREALAEQGISLGEASVGEQRTGHDDGPARQPGEMLASSGLDDSGDDAPGAADNMTHRELALDGRVDLYA